MLVTGIYCVWGYGNGRVTDGHGKMALPMVNTVALRCLDLHRRQIRWGASEGVLAGFDSQALPPFLSAMFSATYATCCNRDIADKVSLALPCAVCVVRIVVRMVTITH